MQAASKQPVVLLDDAHDLQAFIGTDRVIPFQELLFNFTTLRCSPIYHLNVLVSTEFLDFELFF